MNFELSEDQQLIRDSDLENIEQIKQKILTYLN